MSTNWTWEYLTEATISTLGDTSLDDDKGSNMMESQLSVFDCDKLKETYELDNNSNFGLYKNADNKGFVLKSVDALHPIDFTKDSDFWLVEFKNGSLKDIDRKLQVIEKLYDTLRVIQELFKLRDITLTPEYMQKHCHFVLIYNDVVNMSKREKNQRNPSPLSKMQNTLNNKGTLPPIKICNYATYFCKFPGYFIKDMLLCTPEEYQDVLDNPANSRQYRLQRIIQHATHFYDEGEVFYKS